MIYKNIYENECPVYEGDFSEGKLNGQGKKYESNAIEEGEFWGKARARV